MHKDQQRIVEKLLPEITGLTSTKEGERDCTILNRALVQGPDPLFLMETCPEEFKELCEQLHLSVEEGAKAIENAHWMGPAVLLDASGINPIRWEAEQLLSEGGKGGPDKLLLLSEGLWLIMASVSDCTEEGYKTDSSLKNRFIRANQAAIKLYKIVSDIREGVTSPEEIIFGSLRKFQETTQFVLDDKGIPHTDVDHGFYILYKMGYKAVAVHTDGPTFYGTPPNTSLAEQCIKVGKQISPQFGLNFNDPLPQGASITVLSLKGE